MLCPVKQVNAYMSLNNELATCCDDREGGVEVVSNMTKTKVETKQVSSFSKMHTAFQTAKSFF
jgi:hypothetical protein